MTDPKRPLATTAERYKYENASGNVKGSNFPHHEVRSQPGYFQRERPGLAAADVTNELALYLSEFAKQQGSPLPYRRRDVSYYLWMQASRRMLPWEVILRVVRWARRRGSGQPIAHYFGYWPLLGKEGTKRRKELLKLVRYVTQEGVCDGCGIEFQYGNLTRDRTKPGKAWGSYVLPNVQLMCKPCNNLMGANCDQLATRP